MASSSGASSSKPKRTINTDKIHRRDSTKFDLGTYNGGYGGEFMLGMDEESYVSDDENHLFPLKQDFDEDRLFSSVEVKRDLLVGKFGKYYSNKLLRVRKNCTRGGAIFDGKEFTYLHDKNLFMGDKKVAVTDHSRMYQVLEFTGSCYGKPIDTSILVEKKSIYLIATKHPGEKWSLFRDYVKKVNLANSVTGDCESRYKGKERGNYVGRGTLMSALYNYRYGETLEKKQDALQCIIHHIAEAVRFKDAKSLAVEAMDDGVPRLIDHLLVHFNNWQNRSDYIIRHKYPSEIDRKLLEDHNKAELKRNNGVALTDEENKSIQVWTEMMKEKKRSKDLIMCGCGGDSSDKHHRYMDAQKKARSLKKNIDDIKRLKAKSCNLNKVELARRRARLLEKWKSSNTDPDVWDVLAQALIDAEDDVAKLAVFHGNIIVIKRDLSQTQSDLGVPYTISKPDLESFISTAKPEAP